MIVVSDTSPLTSLLQVGQIDLLAKLYREVLVPEAVHRELLLAHAILPAFLRVKPVSRQSEVQRLQAEIDLGEAEAIVLAKEQSAALLLIDETEGRRVARREGLTIIGLLGVLVQAKRSGLIPSVRELVSKLEQVADFRVTEEVKDIIFRSAGE